MTPSHLPSPIFHFLSFPFLSFPFFSFISILSLPLCPSLSFVPCAEQSNKQLIDQGRKWMDETDASLERSRRVVEQTRQVGAETAAALHEQTIQMERVVNKLDEMQVSVNPPPTLPSAPTRQHAHTHTHALAHTHSHTRTCSRTRTHALPPHPSLVPLSLSPSLPLFLLPTHLLRSYLAQFTLKKSRLLIRHLTRSIATDRCFQYLLGLIGLGVIVIIVLRFTGKDGGQVQIPGEEEAPAPPPG